MNSEKLFRWSIVAMIALVAMVLVWRSDLVQELVRPDRFWTHRILIMELEVDNLRKKIAECSGTGVTSSIATPARAPAEGGVPSETVAKLCSSYDEDLKAAVESLLAAKKKLKEARG